MLYRKKLHVTIFFLIYIIFIKPCHHCLFIYFSIFDVDHFKVFIEFVIILLLFYILVFWPGGMWDLGSLTRDQTHTHCIAKRSRSHWATREVPRRVLLILTTSLKYIFILKLRKRRLREVEICPQSHS